MKQGLDVKKVSACEMALFGETSNLLALVRFLGMISLEVVIKHGFLQQAMNVGDPMHWLPL